MINIIAIIAMIIDHLGIVFFPEAIFFRIVGRLSFPLFAYGIANGFKKTKNLKYYAIRLILLAIISQIPFKYLFNNNELNICFTLFIGLIILKIFHSRINILKKITIIIFLMIMAQIFNFQYGIYGIGTILIFDIVQYEDKLIYYQFIWTLISIIIFRYDPIQFFSIFSSIFILFNHLLFKDTDIKINRAFQYSIYPGHIIMLYWFKSIGGI